MKRNRIRVVLLPSASSKSYSFSIPRVLIYFCFGTLLVSWMVLGIGGSWLAPRALIRSGDWDGIRARAEEARRAVDLLDRGPD